MPKVYTQRANKDYPAEGIKKGQTYYAWSLRPGGPYSAGRSYRSPTYPTPRQLTANAFKLAVYDLEDQLSGISVPEGDDADEIKSSVESEIESLVSAINDLAQEQRDKKDNMPEGLQESDTGQLLEERADALENWASELESLNVPDPEDIGEDQTYRELVLEFLDCEVHSTSACL